MTTDQLRAQVAAQVAALPTKPGVYTFRDAAGRVIYVGKAANLRSRVRSYFGSPRALEGKTRQLAAKIAQLDIVTTRTEQDALHLEATLVKRHQPFFNVRLKDDKHYPYLKVDVDSPWPRVTITRRVQNDGARYFGPYASANRSAPRSTSSRNSSPGAPATRRSPAPTRVPASSTTSAAASPPAPPTARPTSTAR